MTVRTDLEWTEHDIEIVKKRIYFFGHSVQDVARYFGVSRQRLDRVMKDWGIPSPRTRAGKEFREEYLKLTKRS